ncbi:MAG: ribosomal protein S4 [Candidatus Nanosalina sp. J07AB43]|nr:MAG: ribosomal protein S4 [Candidatus Nanosalina sp. J07AB43]
MVKKLKKQYDTPSEAYDEDRIEQEKELMDEYGLRNKREVYKAESELRGLRRQARKAVAADDNKQIQPLLDRAHNLGLVRENASIEDVLSLKSQEILERRIQTAVERKGYAETVKEARQLIVHGHIYINDQQVTVPGYLLTQEEERNLELDMPEQEDEEEQEEVEESSEGENQEENGETEE